MGIDVGKPISGVWDLRGSGRPDHGAYYSKLAHMLERALSADRPDLVIMEAPMKAKARAAVARKRGAPERDSTTRLLHTLCGVVEMICHEQSVPCEEEEVLVARRAVLGRQPKGGDAKAAVMNWCRMIGFDPVDDNAADAMVLWEYRHGLERKRSLLRRSG